MANAIRTGVTVLDFRHIAHHSQVCSAWESNIFTSIISQLIMAKIESSVVIDASSDRVWEIISDIDNEPKFWKGTKAVRNITVKNDTIEREITIAFRDQKCLQTVRLFPKERVEAVFTKGIIDGIKSITLTPKDGKTNLDVMWDIKMTGIMGMFTGMIKKHIKSGTEQALENIKKEIEK